MRIFFAGHGRIPPLGGICGEVYLMYAAAGNPRRTQSSGKKTIYGWTVIKRHALVMDHTRFVVRRSRILNTGARYSAVREKGCALKLACQPAIGFSPKIEFNTEKGGHLRPDERFRKTAETRRQRALRPDRSRLQIMSLDAT